MCHAHVSIHEISENAKDTDMKDTDAKVDAACAPELSLLKTRDESTHVDMNRWSDSSKSSDSSESSPIRTRRTRSLRSRRRGILRLSKMLEMSDSDTDDESNPWAHPRPESPIDIGNRMLAPLKNDPEAPINIGNRTLASLKPNRKRPGDGGDGGDGGATLANDGARTPGAFANILSQKTEQGRRSGRREQGRRFGSRSLATIDSDETESTDDTESELVQASRNPNVSSAPVALDERGPKGSKEIRLSELKRQSSHPPLSVGFDLRAALRKIKRVGYGRDKSKYVFSASRKSSPEGNILLCQLVLDFSKRQFVEMDNDGKVLTKTQFRDLDKVSLGTRAQVKLEFNVGPEKELKVLDVELKSRKERKDFDRLVQVSQAWVRATRVKTVMPKKLPKLGKTKSAPSSSRPWAVRVAL